MYSAQAGVFSPGAHRLRMANIALENVLPILQSFLASVKTGPAPSEADRLSDMGLDSLTTINVIVTAAEKLGLDLERLDEITEAPATLGDILSILNRLGGGSANLN
jgi:acyl carrier protein